MRSSMRPASRSALSCASIGCGWRWSSHSYSSSICCGVSASIARSISCTVFIGRLHHFLTARLSAAGAPTRMPPLLKARRSAPILANPSLGKTPKFGQSFRSCPAHPRPHPAVEVTTRRYTIVGTRAPQCETNQTQAFARRRLTTVPACGTILYHDKADNHPRRHASTPCRPGKRSDAGGVEDRALFCGSRSRGCVPQA